MQATCHPDRPHRAKGMCSSCYSTHLSRLWRQNHPGYESARKKEKNFKFPPRTSEQKTSRRQRDLLKKYGLTQEQFDEILIEQKGRCAICAKAFNDVIKPNVDHDHQTGVIRGLLCSYCNRAIGLFADNLAIIQASMHYLDGSAYIKILHLGVPIMIEKLKEPIMIGSSELN